MILIIEILDRILVILMALISHLEKSPIRRVHIEILIINSLAYALTAMNVMIIAPLLTSIQTELGIESTVILGVVISSTYFGMLVGAFSFGRLSDLFGRKKVLALGLAIHGIFTALTGLAYDALSLAIIRFIAGIGLGGSLPIPGVYMSEYPPAKYRGTFVGLVETSWVWGAILSLVISRLVLPLSNWRTVLFFGLGVLLVIPLVLLFLPESIRYLEIKGKEDEAIDILRKYGIIGEDETIEITKAPKETYSWKIFFSRKYLQRTLIIIALWMVLNYTYHGIFIWLPKTYARMGYSEIKSIEWTIYITLAQIPGYYSAAFLLDKIGRKKVLSIYLFGAAIGCAVILTFPADLNMIFVGSIIVSFFNLGAWSAVYTYTPELYPTELRGTFSGLGASFGRIAAIIAQPITGFLFGAGGALFPFFAFLIVHLIGAFTSMLGPETKGKTLEEI